LNNIEVEDKKTHITRY